MKPEFPDPIIGNPKAREVMLYIAKKLEDDRNFGMTKLYKIIFYADLAYRSTHGRTITGGDYEKLPFGPAPSTYHADLSDLQRSGSAIVDEVCALMDTYPRKRLKALRDPDFTILDPSEVLQLDQTIADLRPLNARRLSTMSHELPFWRWANLGEVMDWINADSPVRVSMIQLKGSAADSAMEEARRQGLV